MCPNYDNFLLLIMVSSSRSIPAVSNTHSFVFFCVHDTLRTFRMHNFHLRSFNSLFVSLSRNWQNVEFWRSLLTSVGLFHVEMLRRCGISPPILNEDADSVTAVTRNKVKLEDYFQYSSGQIRYYLLGKSTIPYLTWANRRLTPCMGKS